MCVCVCGSDGGFGRRRLPQQRPFGRAQVHVPGAADAEAHQRQLPVQQRQRQRRSTSRSLLQVSLSLSLSLYLFSSSPFVITFVSRHGRKADGLGIVDGEPFARNHVLPSFFSEFYRVLPSCS